MNERIFSQVALQWLLLAFGLIASVAGWGNPTSDASGADIPASGSTADFANDIRSEAEQLPSISATHIRRHERSGIEIMRATVELSPLGLRVRQARQGERHQEMLQDFVANEAWLVNRKRNVVHRLPLADDEFGDPGVRPGDSGSFLGKEPCTALLESEDAGTGTWRGRNVHAWHCKNEAGEIVDIEFVDDVYGIVVFKRTVDGIVDELQNLKDREYPDDHFKPASHLRSISAKHFFGGVPDIPQYKEDNQ